MKENLLNFDKKTFEATKLEKIMKNRKKLIRIFLKKSRKHLKIQGLEMRSRNVINSNFITQQIFGTENLYFTIFWTRSQKNPMSSELKFALKNIYNHTGFEPRQKQSVTKFAVFQRLI